MQEITIPNCACGSRMLVTGAQDVFVCVNCDGIQPRELEGKPRSKSKLDHAFESTMRSRQKQWYPSQFGGKDEKGSK